MLQNTLKNNIKKRLEINISYLSALVLSSGMLTIVHCKVHGVEIFLDETSRNSPTGNQSCTIRPSLLSEASLVIHQG